MRRRILISAGTMVFLLLCVVLYAWIRPQEPHFDRAPLSYWAEQYARSSAFGDHSVSPLETSNAIYHIGPRAIPYALKQLNASAKPRAWAFLHSMPVMAKLVNRQWEQRMIEEYAGQLIFQILGSKGAPATNELVKMLYLTNSASRAAIALSSIGSAGVGYLLEARTNSVQVFRSAAVVGLAASLLHTNIDLQIMAFHSLLQTNGDSNPSQAMLFTQSGLLHNKAEVVALTRRLPALLQIVTNALTAKNAAQRIAASNALQKIHQSTTNPVVPIREN